MVHGISITFSSFFFIASDNNQESAVFRYVVFDCTWKLKNTKYTQSHEHAWETMKGPWIWAWNWVKHWTMNGRIRWFHVNEAGVLMMMLLLLLPLPLIHCSYVLHMPENAIPKAYTHSNTHKHLRTKCSEFYSASNWAIDHWYFGNDVGNHIYLLASLKWIFIRSVSIHCSMLSCYHIRTSAPRAA